MSLRLNELLTKMSGSQAVDVQEAEETSVNNDARTDTEYVEKLASAVDFIINKAREEGITKEASDTQELLKAALRRKVSTEIVKEAAEETPEKLIDGAVSKIRASLITKIAANKEDKEVEQADFIGNIIGRISEMKASNEPEIEIEDDDVVEDVTATIHSADDSVETVVINDEADISAEDSTKTAGKLTLSDYLLGNVLSSDSEEGVVSAEESVKTASDKEEGKSVSSKLKNSLLSRVRNQED